MNFNMITTYIYSPTKANWCGSPVSAAVSAKHPKQEQRPVTTEELGS